MEKKEITTEQKQESTIEKKRIRSSKEAQAAFLLKFGSLVEAFGPGKKNYRFQKAVIIINGQEIEAYIAHNDEQIYTLVVPVNGDEPTIENFDDITIVKKVNSAEQAKIAFIAEFGSLIRLLNPASTCFDGYVFVKRKITVDGETFKAYIAWDTAQTTMFIVPVNGDKPDIQDYNNVTVHE